MIRLVRSVYRMFKRPLIWVVSLFLPDGLLPHEVGLMIRGRIYRAYQLRYFVRDYLIRKPYKVIVCRSEFGPELKFYLPFAYWHYRNGTLLRTESLQGTKELYFFSPHHVERAGERRYLHSIEIPNSEDHNFTYDLRKWACVPLRLHFSQSGVLNTDKPILIISNKFNTEWGREPVNFLCLDTLAELCGLLVDKYTVVYNRPRSSRIVDDNSSVLDLGDYEYLAGNQHDVVLAERLYEDTKENFTSFNHFQFCLYAQCSRFISVQGGNSVLASYFGGTNVTLYKKGAELTFNETESFYPRLSDAQVIRCSSDDELLVTIRRVFLEP